MMCPASMCPLFAKNGSVWTNEKSAICPQKGGLDSANECPWWDMGCQEGQHHMTIEIIAEVKSVNKPASYDCTYANCCSWQQNSITSLCPPRTLLSLGINPKYARF